MSEEESEKFVSLDDIYLRELKDKIDSPWRLQRQLERCNILAAGENEKAFQDSVEITLDELPIEIKSNVMARENEYWVTPEPDYQFKYNCGVPVGSIEQPVMLNDPEDWDYDSSRSTVPWSPVLVETPPYIDHKKLLAIIKEEAERGGLSWQYEKFEKEVGRIPQLIPEPILEDYERLISQTMLEHRRQGIMYSFNDLLESLQKLKPKTPTPPRGENIE